MLVVVAKALLYPLAGAVVGSVAGSCSQGLDASSGRCCGEWTALLGGVAKALMLPLAIAVVNGQPRQFLVERQMEPLSDRMRMRSEDEG